MPRRGTAIPPAAPKAWVCIYHQVCRKSLGQLVWEGTMPCAPSGKRPPSCVQVRQHRSEDRHHPTASSHTRYLTAQSPGF